MDLERAHAILGVDASTPLSDVKAAYRARARLFHPDRLQEDDQLNAEGGRAMAELTEAWSVVESAGENRQHLESQAADPADADLRLPNRGECDLCGPRPAQNVHLRSATGMLLSWRWQPMEAEVCRVCAMALFREAQAHNMTRAGGA
jgi:hypothetical protein